MLRASGRRLSSLPLRSLKTTSVAPHLYGNGSSSPSDASSTPVFPGHPLYFRSGLTDLIRGYSSGDVRDLQDKLKAKNPERFVNGIHTHLGSLPLPKGLLPYQHVSVRHYASPAADQTNNTPHSLRPLSPHLPVYQPQLNSTLSIFNRISGVYLTAVLLSFYLLTMKMGSICLTYDAFYKTLFYSAKLVPITLEISALALAYHLYASIRHWKGP